MIQEGFKCAPTYADWPSTNLSWEIQVDFLLTHSVLQGLCSIFIYRIHLILMWFEVFHTWLGFLVMMTQTTSSRNSFLRLFLRPSWCCIKAVLSTELILITLQVHGWEAGAFYHQGWWIHNKEADTLIKLVQVGSVSCVFWAIISVCAQAGSTGINQMLDVGLKCWNFYNLVSKQMWKRGVFESKFNSSFGFNAESCIMLIAGLSPITSKWSWWKQPCWC